MDEDEDFEVKCFFAHVISRSEELPSQTLFANSECYISEVLTHIDLLERTVRSVGDSRTDAKQLNDLRVVFLYELLEKATASYICPLSNSKEWTPRFPVIKM